MEETSTIDVKSERGQERVIQEYLSATGYGTAEEIAEEIEVWKDLGKLEQQALKFQPKLQKMQEKVVAKKLQEQDMKKKQQDQIADQTEVYDKTKHEVKQGLTRYEHLSAIMSLMPDELEQSIAQMVKESCPELDLIQVDTPEMKQIIEEQPENFIDQLIRELHDVCDMFGLIDDSKVVTKVINGVEVQIYADDWFKGEKKQW